MSDVLIVNVGEHGWLVGLEEFAKQWGSSGPDLLDHDGAPLRRSDHRRGWWFASERPRSLTYEKPRRRTPVRAVLTKPELHEIDPVRWPRERMTSDDFWDSSERDDYTVEYREEPAETVSIDLADATVIDDPGWRQAVPNFDRETLQRWRPDLLQSALYSPELGPWLPGRLTGFRAHMAGLVAANPGVTDVYCKGFGSGYEPSDGPLFRVRQPWSDGRTTTVGKGRNRRQQATWVTITVPLADVPTSISGRDLWDAVERWEAAEAEWLARWEQIGAQACGHCDGRGWVRR